MSLVESIYMSGRIVYVILVPVFRELSAVLLAFAISKDCKARDNGSGALWGLFTLITPVLSGIIYFIYSRLLVKRKAKTPDDNKKIKSSYRLTAAAILMYIISLVIAVTAIVTTLASGTALLSDEENIGNNLENLLEAEYYDRNGIRYDSGEAVILYDKDGNKYHYAESPNGFNYFTYFDDNGNEYDIEYCYISKDGYFYYDESNALEDSDDLWYYDKHFYDRDGNEYAHIDDYAYWDEDGNICVVYMGTHYRYPFIE
ncbi:MAG: hypothetical protein NC397_08675 [Clostridium sp.]|nr:hypothetical protein [Clostridium sp.]